MGVVNKPVRVMKSGERRALTEGEIKLGRVVFGEEIDWPRIGVSQAPALGFGAMVPFGRTIVFANWRAACDFTETSPYEQGWLVHELMHVWQAAHGTFLAIAKLGALGKNAYMYLPRAGAKLSHYNIERQAEIARHLYLARIGAEESGAPAREWLENVWASRF
jgi:hypothetical protein